MLYEEDEILKEKWIAEERERRLKLKAQQQQQLKPSDKTNILKLTKAKRSIDPLPTFGHVKETEDVKRLMPKKDEQNQPF